MPEFIKLCTTHAKRQVHRLSVENSSTDILSRGVLELKSHVFEEDRRCLMDFVYIDSAEKLQEFDNFV